MNKLKENELDYNGLEDNESEDSDSEDNESENNRTDRLRCSFIKEPEFSKKYLENCEDEYIGEKTVKYASREAAGKTPYRGYLSTLRDDIYNDFFSYIKKWDGINPCISSNTMNQFKKMHKKMIATAIIACITENEEETSSSPSSVHQLACTDIYN